MKKFIKITLIIISFLLIILAIIIFLINNNYKNQKIGNNKSIEEIKNYILNIKTYRANLEMTVINNRNENKYKLIQEVKEGYEKQVMQEPEEIKDLEMTYKDGKLEIKNTKLNLNKIYENYLEVSNNNLFLTEFLKCYKEKEGLIENEENTVILNINESKNKYNNIQRLYVNKDSLKPEKLEIYDDNNKLKVYILYNEIEINI